MRNLSHIRLLLLIAFAFSLAACSGSSPTKFYNPDYKEKVFKDKTVAIFIKDSLKNSADHSTNEFLENNYGSFESFFNEYFPRYLAEYSLARVPYLTRIDDKYFTDLLFYNNKQRKEHIASPARKTILRDAENKIPDLVLILIKPTLRSFYISSGKISESQGYLSQTSGRDAHININCRMILWDNNIGEAISFGECNSVKYIPPLVEMTRSDMEDCIKLFVSDITVGSPLCNYEKISELKKIQ
ncbi:MAG: hypothetical protein ACM34K_17525 [Bacillota bacterium]